MSRRRMGLAATVAMLAAGSVSAPAQEADSARVSMAEAAIRAAVRTSSRTTPLWIVARADTVLGKAVASRLGVEMRDHVVACELRACRMIDGATSVQVVRIEGLGDVARVRLRIQEPSGFGRVPIVERVVEVLLFRDRTGWRLGSQRLVSIT